MSIATGQPLGKTQQGLIWQNILTLLQCAIRSEDRGTSYQAGGFMDDIAEKLQELRVPYPADDVIEWLIEAAGDVQ